MKFEVGQLLMVLAPKEVEGSIVRVTDIRKRGEESQIWYKYVEPVPGSDRDVGMEVWNHPTNLFPYIKTNQESLFLLKKD